MLSSSSSSSSFQLDIFIVLERHSLFFLSLESYTQKFFLSLLFFLALNGSVGSRADSRTEK